MTARSWIFIQLALQHQGLQTSFEAQGEEMKKKEEEPKRALGEEKSATWVQRELDQVLKVKDQLNKEHDTLQKEKASIEKERDTLKAGLAKRAKLDRKIKKMVADAEAEAKAAKDDLAAHKAVSVKWLADLASLNEDMDRKLAESPFSILLLSNSQFCVRSHLIQC